MSPDRLDRGVALAAQLAYVLFVIAILFVLFPQARQLLRKVAAGMVWNYQLGSYLMRRQPTPGWVRAAVEAKPEDLAEEK